MKKKISQPEDLDKLDKEGLIEFLRSDREDKVELWNEWHFELAFKIGHSKIDLKGVDLSDKELSSIDLSFADLVGANLDGANLENAELGFSHLESTSLWDTNFKGASLRRSHMEGADLHGAYLVGADLREVYLQGVDLSGLRGQSPSSGPIFDPEESIIVRDLYPHEKKRLKASTADLDDDKILRVPISLFNQIVISKGALRGVKLYNCYFWGVLSLSYREFLENPLDRNGASTIWEDVQGRFTEAREIYRSLKGYFEDTGDYAGVNWAYENEQHMTKLMYAPYWSRWLYPQRRGKWQPSDSAEIFWRENTWEWLRLEIAEKTANYGLSLPRPLMCLAAVVVLFTLVYWLGGLVTAMPECAYGAGGWHEGCAPSANPVDALVFSLGSLTSTEIAAVQPYRSHVGLIQTFEVLLGIAFTGLFGFVLGNRLRYS